MSQHRGRPIHSDPNRSVPQLSACRASAKNPSGSPGNLLSPFEAKNDLTNEQSSQIILR